MVGDLIICLLAFFYIFISFYLFFFLFKKKRGPEAFYVWLKALFNDFVTELF